MKKKLPTYYFTLRSSRGSRHDLITEIAECDTPQNASNDWADRIMRGSPIESATITYQKVTPPTRKQLLKLWHTACKKRAKIEDECSYLRALLAFVK